MAKKKAVITCGCRQCTWGMHHSSWSKTKVQDTIQKLRHDTRQFLKKGEYDKALDVIVSTGYLD